MYKLTVNMPNLPKGDDVIIDGLGVFKNGETSEVTAEQAAYFRRHHGGLAWDEAAEADVWKDGRTLLEASKNMFGVEVAVDRAGRTGNNNEDGDK